MDRINRPAPTHPGILASTIALSKFLSLTRLFSIIPSCKCHEHAHTNERMPQTHIYANLDPQNNHDEYETPTLQRPQLSLKKNVKSSTVKSTTGYKKSATRYKKQLAANELTNRYKRICRSLHTQIQLTTNKTCLTGNLPAKS